MNGGSRQHFNPGFGPEITGSMIIIFIGIGAYIVPLVKLWTRLSAAGASPWYIALVVIGVTVVAPVVIGCATYLYLWCVRGFLRWRYDD